MVPGNVLTAGTHTVVGTVLPFKHTGGGALRTIFISSLTLTTSQYSTRTSTQYN